MKSFQFDYAVIGGDLRQTYLIQELVSGDTCLCHFGLCQEASDWDKSSVKKAATLKEAIENSANILCPIPFSSLKKNISINQILMELKPNQCFFAGSIPDYFRFSAEEGGVYVFDYMRDITLSYFNTLATAEGVICEAIKNCPRNLHHSKCAVLGYGKCGSTIANYLKGMFCHVTIVTSQETELVQGALVAEKALDLEAFFAEIGEYDFIFNTIPAVILTREILSRLNPDVTILDIASYPGGIDFSAAKELSITAILCPSLPGRYAPASSAKAIKEFIKKSIKSLERKS